MIVVGVFFLFKVALAAKSDDVVFDRNVEILALHARQFSLQHDLILVLIDVNIRTPGSASNAFVVESPGKISRKQTIYLFLEGSQIAKRVVTNDTHNYKPPDFVKEFFLV